VQETTTIIGSTTYLRKAGLSRKHLLLASSLFVFFFFFAFCGLLFWIWDVSSSSFVTDIPGPPSPPRQLGAKWPSWIGCVLLYRRNLHCFFFFFLSGTFPIGFFSDSLSLFFLCISSLEGKPPSPQTLRRYVGGSPDRTLAELNTHYIVVRESIKIPLPRSR
jgi:hypothetical protein